LASDGWQDGQQTIADGKDCCAQIPDAMIYQSSIDNRQPAIKEILAS